MSELDDVTPHRRPPRVCGCGCGGVMVNPHARRRYLDGHRDRVYRRKLQTAAEAAGIETRLSLKTVQATNASLQRRADAKAGPTRRKRAPRRGVSVYLPDPLLAARVAEVLGYAIANEGQGDLAPALDAVVKARDRARAKSGD